jgi:tetratricopeptide (TPR) repeat protein
VPLPAPGAADPFAFPPPGEAPPPPDEPLPVPVPDLATEPTIPDLAPPPLADVPLPELSPAEPPAPAAPSLAFGEVDLGAEAAPAAPPDPFSAPPLPPIIGQAPTPQGQPAEELEMLFGEGGSAPARAPAAGAGQYKVRRRSGKIFGPFDEEHVVEMLQKGELMGNEDVSSDGGGSWSPIGGVAAFGAALASVVSEPRPTGGDARRMAPFGDRMAASRVVDGGQEEAPRFSIRKLAIPAAVVAVLLAVGAGAGLTRHGFFFLKTFRRGDAARVAALLATARGELAKGDYPGERAALDAAAQAVTADPDERQAGALYAVAVASLELRHGAPQGALDRARAAADRLDKDDKASVPALTARLAVRLATGPGPETVPDETALEQASAKHAPDADTVALLARAALARGDAAGAATQFTRLESIAPGTPRAGLGAGQAAMARRDAKAARGAFEKVLAKVPGHLPTRLELAALAEAAGDTAEAEAQLAWLFKDGAGERLAPAEKARASILKGLLLARESSKGAEVEKAFQAALDADPRLLDARLALARHRLRRGDAVGAVTALDGVAGQAATIPALAAVRIRALAAAGRALDASSLADQALGKTPGEPGLLLAKAAALEAAGKGDDARQLYKDAAARDPGAFEPRLALGRLALARRDLEQARVELTAAAEKGPREPAAQTALGDLAALGGDSAAAEKAYQAALGLEAGYVPAEIGLAKLALARGDERGARGRLERALAVDGRSVEGQVTYGTLCWKAHDLPAAEKAFQAAVDLSPRAALALSRLGAVKLERGADLDGAVQRLTAATGEDPGLAEARLWLGRALLAKNETPGAIAMLRKAVDLDGKNPEHHLYLGAALERSGAFGEAVESYRASIEVDPRFADGYDRLGALLVSSSRWEDAAAAYQKAVAAAPKVSRYRLALADCKRQLGKNDEAIRIYHEVMKLDPAAVQVYYRLARALHESQGARAALPWYERAAKEDAKNPMPHYYLGYLYKERGQRSKAVAEFRRFLELKPDADEKKDIEGEIEDLGGNR